MFNLTNFRPQRITVLTRMETPYSGIVYSSVETKPMSAVASPEIRVWTRSITRLGQQSNHLSLYLGV